MKPCIGITAAMIEGKLVLNEQYVRTVRAMDAMPLVIPASGDEQMIRDYVERLDGWLLSGGADVDPSRYGEEPLPELGPVYPERDQFEIELIRTVIERDKPIMAICRGMQVLNVACGGTLYQDIRYVCDDPLQHQQKSAHAVATHTVEIGYGTKLHRIMQREQIRTNSLHHQAVKQIASGFSVCARAKDGVVEAIESPSHRFVLGVQWHPEAMAPSDEHAAALFRSWIEACRSTT